MKKNIDTQKILENIASLKLFEDTQDLFWKEYLENIALLCRSKIAILISKDDENWSFNKEYIEDDILKNEKDDILKLSIQCSSRALDNIYAYERFKDNKYIVSIALDTIDEDKQYVVVLLIENSDKKEFSNLVIRATLCRDIPLNYELLKLEPSQIEDNNSLTLDKNNNLGDILFLLNTVMYEKKFKLSCMKIVDEFANKFNCNKVSIGWEYNDYIKIVAINQVEHFSKSTDAIKSLEAIFEESYEQDEEIFYPEDENTNLITNSHKIYLIDNKLTSLYTFPIRVDEKIISIISFEKKDGTLSEKDLETIRLSLNFIAPVLNNIFNNDKNIFSKTYSFIKKSASYIFGPKNTLYKLFIVILTGLLLWIAFGKWEYKVEAVANLQTDNTLYLSAPFDGIVNSVDIDVGDSVKKDKSLVNFDTQELSLKKLEINSDIIRYSTEAEKARANRKLADMKISLAKKEQSIASLKKIDYYLSQADIKAPFDGIIVEGDKEKLLGSPFSKGDILIQIANPIDLYAKIKVLEEYIDDIKVGQIAKLNLLSRPDIFFNVRIEKIIPMAKVDDVNGNVFSIKVIFLDKTQDWMRPGMSGIAKINIEERSLLWILTHKISDYIYMNIWW